MPSFSDHHPMPLLTMRIHELAEIPVRCQDNSLLASGKGDHIGIFCSRRHFRDGMYVIPRISHRTNNPIAATFIYEKSHRLFPSGSLSWAQETGTRVPRMTGLPITTLGFISIRSVMVIGSPPFLRTK